MANQNMSAPIGSNAVVANYAYSSVSGAVVVQQPSAIGLSNLNSVAVPGTGQCSVDAGSMPGAGSVANCPRGLECLVALSKVELILQSNDALENCCSCDDCHDDETRKYLIQTSEGQRLFTAEVINGLCLSSACGGSSLFDVTLFDSSEREVMRVEHPNVGCCNHELVVEAPPDALIGKVRETQSCCKPEYTVLDADDGTVLKIEGPCGACCESDLEFYVLGHDKVARIGSIVAKYNDSNTHAKKRHNGNFDVTFPRDLAVSAKASILAATFFINLIYFAV